MKLFEFAAMIGDEDKLRDFLVRHHVIAGVCSSEECGHICCIDRRKKQFRCDQRVTVLKHRAYKGHK